LTATLDQPLALLLLRSSIVHDCLFELKLLHLPPLSNVGNLPAFIIITNCLSSDAPAVSRPELLEDLPERIACRQKVVQDEDGARCVTLPHGLLHNDELVQRRACCDSDIPVLLFKIESRLDLILVRRSRRRGHQKVCVGDRSLSGDSNHAPIKRVCRHNGSERARRASNQITRTRLMRRSWCCCGDRRDRLIQSSIPAGKTRQCYRGGARVALRRGSSTRGIRRETVAALMAGGSTGRCRHHSRSCSSDGGEPDQRLPSEKFARQRYL
jgi:hypothetical protein